MEKKASAEKAIREIRSMKPSFYLLLISES